ncbi:uncharacterized protein sytl2a isoform X10 [Amia ocellicauda]|uniref:uncharacterized protein sytl2a isoform X10 n=1 Tax=Amia ocellicauda TaxID=2972642 RepID=UPI0034640712
MIDLSYLTEDEQQMIMTVLKRDAELKKAEEDRIKQLQNTVHDNGKLKYMTGEWFYEAKSKRHRDKIHGSDIIRASMRQKKPVTLLELSQTRGGERPSFINNGNRDIFVSPELSGLIEEPEEEEDQEGERKAVNPSLDTKHNRLKLSASSPAKQRLNPFNSVSVRAETADEKDSQLTNGVVQALKTSNGENLPPTQNTLPSVINLNSESPGSSQQNIEQLPVPKKRTKIYKPQDSFSDSDGPFPRLSNKRDSVKNPGTPRGILKHNSSCSSNDSEMLQSGHNVNRPEPPSSRTPNAQTVVPQIAAERVEDSREGTEEFSFNSLERKQVRFSPSVRQKDLNRALELQDGRELGEHDMLDLDSTSTPDAEEDYILDRSEQDNGGGSGLSLTDALTEEFQEPEDSTLTSATTTLSDNAQPLSLSVNEVGPAGAGEREQLRSKGTEPPVAYLGLHSRSTDNCKQGDTGQHEYHAESNPLQVSNLVSSSDEKEVQNEEHMKYTPKSIFVSEEMYNCSAALKHDESESPKAGEQVSESVSLAKHSMHAWQSSPVPLVRQSLRQEEDSKTNKISDLNSPLEKEHSGPKILMSKPKEDSPKDETSIKTPSQETESDSILEVQNEEQMKYNPKSIIVNEEVYDSSAAMIPDESKSPKAGEQVSELVSLAKHSTHVLQSSPVPLVRHLSQEDSKTNKISDLNSPLEKEHSDPKILMSKPKVDSPKDETSIKTPSQETKSDSFSEVQNEEQMKYTPKSIIVNEEVYDSSAALKSEGSENQQAREQVYESVALAKHSTHVLQSSLVPLVRHLSQEDSKTGKINDLKSFWEKEKSGPKIIIGKPKDVTETCFSGTEGKQHLKDSPLQSSKRFTASEIDLRVDDADPSNGIERKSTSSVSRSKPTFTVLSMKERVQNDPIGPTSLQFKNLRDFWGGTSAAQQRPSLVKLKSGSIESMPVNLKNPTSPTSKAQDKNLFLNPNYYAKVLPTEPESIQGRSFGVEEQPMRESKNETEMKVEQSAPQLSEGKTNVGKGPLPEALARKPPSPTVSFQRQGDLTHGKDVGAEQERFFSRVMERSKGFPPQGQSPQSPPLKSMARSSMSSEVPLQTSGTNVSAVCPPQPARRKHKESPNERQYQTVPQPRLEMHEGDLQERLNEIPPEPFNGTHNGSPSKEENESKAPVMKEDLILKKHQSNVLSPWVKPADEEMSFQTQEIEVPVGIGEKMETHSVLQREDLLEEDDSDHEFGEVAKPVRASTPNMAEDIQGKPSSEMQHSSPLCDNTEDNEYEDSSRSSASDTWSFTWASSACYDEDQNLVRRVLERSSNRPVSSSKSLEDISSSLPRDERSKTTSGDELALSVEDDQLSEVQQSANEIVARFSTVPNTPTTTFLDNEKMKQMSRSVPFLQQESDGTDSTSENSFHIGRKKKIGSSLTNLSNSSGMASMSSVSGSVMSIYSGDFGNVEVKGNIQFAMDYVEQLNEFHIFVVQCKDLAAADPKKNRSDPYVKSYLLPDKGKMGKRKTSVKKKTLNPTYNEILRYRIAMETLKTQTLNLSVWHNDTFGRNSFLGEVDVDLSKWDWNNTQMNFFPLKPRTPSGLQATDYRGEMRLALRFLPQISHSKRTSNAGEVHIWVKDCKSLPIIRGNNIDPFVKCSVLPDTSRKSRQKTRVLKKTANPMFNHTLVYDGFKAEDLREACVELTVWDHDRLVNHFLGGLRLGLGTGKSYGAVVDWMDSNTDEATLWERMIDSPNEWVEDVLPLRMLMMAKSVWK